MGIVRGVGESPPPPEIKAKAKAKWFGSLSGESLKLFVLISHLRPFYAGDDIGSSSAFFVVVCLKILRSYDI